MRHKEKKRRKKIEREKQIIRIKKNKLKRLKKEEREKE